MGAGCSCRAQTGGIGQGCRLPGPASSSGATLVFVALQAELDVRYGSRDGAACAEFSWEGFDDGSPASGRGWAALGTAGRLVGHIFIHKGDDLGFVAERE